MFEETQGANCDCTDKEPLVEILMATYNGARYLGEQIDSILGQTYTHWRLLVNDDGSSDGTVDIVRAYAEKDDRIQLLSLENERHDAAGNFLALLAVSSAPYVMFCDQDDVWLPNKVQLELEAMRDLEREHSADVPLLVFCDSAIVDANLEPMEGARFSSRALHDPRQTTLSQLLVNNVAQGCAMLMNRLLVLDMTCIPMPECIGMHDYWAIVLAEALGGTRFIDTPLLLYRQHADNVSGATKESATAGAGLLHVAKDPSFLKVWAQNIQAEAREFSDRAQTTFDQIGSLAPSNSLAVLNDLRLFYQEGRLSRLSMVSKHKILRGQRNSYSRACQLLGILMVGRTAFHCDLDSESVDV